MHDWFGEAAFDQYITAIMGCESIRRLDEVMEKASADTDVGHHNFVRLCKLAKVRMEQIREGQESAAEWLFDTLGGETPT